MLVMDKTHIFPEKIIFPHDNISIDKGAKIEVGAVIYDGCKIGEHCIVGTNSVLKTNTVLGDHSIFGTLSASEGNVIIGSWTTIHTQCHITWGMTIGNRVFIAPFFYTSNTSIIGDKGCKFGYPNTTDMPRKPPHVEDGVRIGENVGMAPAVIIHKDAIIDMNCLLTRNVPEGAHIRAGREVVGHPL